MPANENSSGAWGTGEPVPKGPPILNNTANPAQRKRFVCVRCGCTFEQYIGMKRKAVGIGYCAAHNPTPKEKSSGSANPV